jgi:hypothetical protein
MAVRDLGQRRDLIGPVDGARFARLRKRERRRHHLMRRMALILRDRRRQRFGRDLAGDPRHADKLEPAAEEFRRAALVGQDMRFGMREHRAPRRAEMGERQRIGRRPGRHQEHGDVALEHLADPPLDGERDIVVAVAQHEAVVAGSERVEDFRQCRRCCRWRTRALLAGRRPGSGPAQTLGPGIHAVLKSRQDVDSRAIPQARP